MRLGAALIATLVCLAAAMMGGFVAAALSSAPGDSYNEMMAGMWAVGAAVATLPFVVIGSFLLHCSRPGIELAAAP